MNDLSIFIELYKNPKNNLSPEQLDNLRKLITFLLCNEEIDISS